MTANALYVEKWKFKIKNTLGIAYIACWIAHACWSQIKYEVYKSHPRILRQFE